MPPRMAAPPTPPMTPPTIGPMSLWCEDDDDDEPLSEGVEPVGGADALAVGMEPAAEDSAGSVAAICRAAEMLSESGLTTSRNAQAGMLVPEGMLTGQLGEINQLWEEN
jgi:hypothetical protein